MTLRIQAYCSATLSCVFRSHFGKGPLESLDVSTQPIQNFMTSLTEVLQDRYKYRALLGLRGDDAQRTLDDLQSVLQFHSRGGSDRSVIIKALTRLATRSGLYPGQLKITELQLLGKGPIGEGSYGQAWRASLGDRVVCVKILRTDQRKNHHRLLKAMLREGLIWAQLSCHPNITPFLGIRVGVPHGNTVGLVSELMPNGTIVEYLKQNHIVHRIGLIHEIASALRHLHGLNIVHGDVKGRNILVNSTGHACLADFGLANVFADNILIWSSLSSGSSCVGGTMRWRAPELLCEEANTGTRPPNTLASDVYSFACTAYEVLADREPFHDFQNHYQLVCKRFNQPNLQPALRTQGNAEMGLTDEVWGFMEAGWVLDPKQRPKMQEMLEMLEMIMN